SPGAPSAPRLGSSVSATCKLIWTYQSVHGVRQYPSYAAAYKADIAEYRQPPVPSLDEILPTLKPMVGITARSSVSIGSIEVAFYDKSGDETGHRAQFAVNKRLARDQGYTAIGAWGVSDPPTGETNVASCAVVGWAPRGRK